MRTNHPIVISALAVATFVGGYAVGHNHTTSPEPKPAAVVALPHCTEDEWRHPETGECVHVDVIVRDNVCARIPFDGVEDPFIATLDCGELP
jgi:hypothetical protein